MERRGCKKPNNYNYVSYHVTYAKDITYARVICKLDSFTPICRPFCCTV